jgi:hypothetical protein
MATRDRGDVDLVVNCYERTFRAVLSPGYFPKVVAGNGREFACRTALINNVNDRAEVEALARHLVRIGDIDRFVFVEDHVDAALAACGLSYDELQPIPFWTDFAAVLVTLDGPDWFVHWDAECILHEPTDWIGPAMDLMDSDARLLSANPNWCDDPDSPWFEYHVGDFGIGQGFSDQVFLGRRRDFGAPIYSQWCIARWCYPMCEIGPIFEARVDAHMRHNGLLRATHRTARYEHASEMGVAYPHASVVSRSRRAARHLFIEGLRRLPWRPQHLRQL